MTARRSLVQFVSGSSRIWREIADGDTVELPDSGSVAGVNSGDQLLPHGLFDFAHADTTDYTTWYAANVVTGVAWSTLALVANRIYTVPFVAPHRSGPTLDRLAIYVTTGASSTNARWGIYSNLSATRRYPGSLLLDAGASATATSSTEIDLTISQALTRGAIYWIAIVSDGTPTIRAGSTNAAGMSLGVATPATGGVTTHLYAAQTYGALPSTFPGSPTAGTAAFPALFYRFAA